MQINEWLNQAELQLKNSDVRTAHLDCLVLLEDETGKDRAWLLSHPEYELQGSILQNLSTKIAQRAQHVPLAYIRGKAEFYGREYSMNAHTLVPRPETEAMIDMLKRVRNREADMHVFPGEPYKRRPKEKKLYPFQKQRPNTSLVKTDEGYKLVWQKLPRSEHAAQPPIETARNTLSYHDEDLCIIDIGTGSGAIAITAKLEIPDATVIATDIDQKCLETAQVNAKKLGADITFFDGNLLEAVTESRSIEVSDDRSGTSASDASVTVLLCNLPYVPDDYQINTAATHEPKLALFGGPDGLDLYRTLFQQIATGPLKPAYVITESLSPQHETLAEIAKSASYRLTRTEDFIQLFELPLCPSHSE